jgi:hypothetical protein
MKKVALVFVIAVIAPSLVLAWLALRSLRDQQILVEHQQAASYQSLADGLARQVNGTVAERLREFNQQVEELIGQRSWYDLAPEFDAELRRKWPLAEVGFVVSLEGEGKVLSPSLFASAETRMFRMENDRFLCNKEAVEVYWNPEGPTLAAKAKGMKEPPRSKSDSPVEQTAESKADDFTVSCVFATKSGKVTCPNPNPIAPKQEEAEFRHLVGDCSEGTMARFLQNKLKLLFWFRPPRDC